MNDALAAKAEILKLARLLRRHPDELQYLERVPPGDLRVLRDQVTDTLFESDGSALRRLAAASRVLPAGVVATIAERSFGPILSARITGLLEPRRAVEVAERLPTPFLADIARELDPRRASAVISRIPPRQIGEITSELVRRDDYITMGRFVGHLGDQAVSAAVGAMDDASLLHVAFVLESNDGLDQLLELIGPERLSSLIEAAARENLWVEVLGLLSSLSAGARQRAAQVLAELQPERREEIARRAREAGFGEELALLEQALG